MQSLEAAACFLSGAEADSSDSRGSMSNKGSVRDFERMLQEIDKHTSSKKLL